MFCGRRLDPPFASGLLIKLSFGFMPSTCTGLFCLSGEGWLQYALLLLDSNVWLKLLSPALHYTLGRFPLPVAACFSGGCHSTMILSMPSLTRRCGGSSRFKPFQFIVSFREECWFWSEWILSSLMVLRRCIEPAPFFVMPPRRCRRRGESPIWVP
jgi:hypothetical protein